MVWRRSSYSGDNGDCVEIGWRKSSYSAKDHCVEIGWRRSSHSASGNCVEVGHRLNGVAVRDSKNVTGPTLAFPTKAWHRFLSRVA